VTGRRQFLKMAATTAGAAALPGMARGLAGGRVGVSAQTVADYTLDIAPYSFEVSAKRFVKTLAYNRQVPGALIRLREGRAVTVDVINRSAGEELVHWHGLALPPEADGAMEEGTPMIAPGAQARYTFTPRPAGMRWYHTHTFAGRDIKRGLYSGLHGFLYVDPRDAAGGYDREIFLALEDWNGHFMGSGDGAMEPAYDVSTINGRTLGFGEPLRVRQGERTVIHLVNMSATDPHWIAFAGHTMRVVALDGNDVPSPTAAPMLFLAPAERVSVEVRMDNPGVWVLGEIRKHVQAAGMGIVVEYAGSTGKPVWQQPEELHWKYGRFGRNAEADSSAAGVVEIPLTFASKFAGHGAPDQWTINGKSYPRTEAVALRRGTRYRLTMKNASTDDHSVHLHRHSFELRRLAGVRTAGIVKDTVQVPAGTEAEVEFTADNPGPTLFHCHQQDHMDMGFMMVFRYA
jgi:FtsP/CotA-like multicopper oxidase with cupredoxin domain